MELSFLKEYVVFVILGICLCIGYILKNFTNANNKYIPLIMGVLGVALNIWLNKFAFTPEILLAGLVSGLASTGAHQAITQLKK